MFSIIIFLRPLVKRDFGIFFYFRLNLDLPARSPEGILDGVATVLPRHNDPPRPTSPEPCATPMARITYITPEFAVATALEPEDFAGLGGLGFRTVINHRPDAEDNDQLASRAASMQAACAGLTYRHIPASKLDLFTDPVVGAMAEALSREPGPILAYCQSGVRAAIVWAAASARSRPVEDVLAALRTAGFDLAFLRDDLDSQHDRMRWAALPLPNATRANGDEERAVA